MQSIRDELLSFHCTFFLLTFVVDETFSNTNSKRQYEQNASDGSCKDSLDLRSEFSVGNLSQSGGFNVRLGTRAYIARGLDTYRMILEKVRTQ